MSPPNANTYTFRTKAGQRLVVTADSYESALTDLADTLGIRLLSAKIAPRPPAPARFQNNVVQFKLLRSGVC
ncbi:hypothetical protein [Bordetella sp. 15P40C-2]|uniref:hypothetical protein n=1 Tax=Bordetella sp. 15P40C-2 TaxID=2572246 RepID=UPI001328DAB6|nr:hypothetical protein [Bordetella sp. 15P40C-2]MVW70106.1 hypothetical protein [Bordetella sp. 15P40C-2]